MRNIFQRGHQMSHKRNDNINEYIADNWDKVVKDYWEETEKPLSLNEIESIISSDKKLLDIFLVALAQSEKYDDRIIEWAKGRYWI